MLADEHPEIGVVGPPTLGGSPVSFMVSVPDVDAMVGRAVAAGGTITRPVGVRFYGHRNGEITDPFGYRWTLSMRVEDLSEEEIHQRAAEDENSARRARRRAEPPGPVPPGEPSEPSLEGPRRGDQRTRGRSDEASRSAATAACVAGDGATPSCAARTRQQRS